MPFVPKRDGSSHSHHSRRRTVVDSIHGPSFTSADGTNLSNNPRGITSSVQNVEAELNNAFVLGTGLFLFLILAYLSRRQIHSRISRLAHALSVHRSASQFIQTHLYTAHYSPLRDLDTTTSPIESEGGNGDLEAAVHAAEELAPPYSPQSSSMRERRSKKPLHITVPVMQSVAAALSRSSQEGSTSTPLVSDAEPTPFSNVSSNSASVKAEAMVASRARSLSNTGVLKLASPVASRFDAFFRPYRHVSILSHQIDGKNPVIAISGDGPCLSNVSNQSESFMSTGSPCATPPPQYTITIHSSHRLTCCDSAGRLASVPDIVLSPVPWLPREHVPQSPPHYLAIPSRKSRSCGHSTKPLKVDLSKLLPATPSQDEKKSEKRARKVKSSGVKVRHVFTSPMPLPAPVPAPKSAAPTSPVSRVLKPKQMSRSSTYPLTTRMLSPLPPPRPVLPMDLEAVYPTYLEEDETPVKTDATTMSGGEESDSWLWPNWPSSASIDRRFARTEDETKRDSYGTEKTIYGERGEWTQAVQHTTSDSEDVPLAQELLKAIRRQKLAFETAPGRHREPPAFDVSQVLRKGLFSGLSAFAAKARMAIERELDSDEEDSIEGEDIMIKEKGEIRHRNFIAREMDAASAFVIGEEEEL